MNILAEQLKEDISLEEKLALIDQALAQNLQKTENGTRVDVPVDPMESLLCVGCQ